MTREATTPPPEPRTAAGRALYQHLEEVHKAGYIGGTTWGRIEAAIPAIEAEAAGSLKGLNSAPPSNDSSLREARELLRAMSSLMHNLSGDAVGHTSFDWRECTQPLCLRVRAALTATSSEPVKITDEQAEHWLRRNDLFVVTHVHTASDCGECNVGGTPAPLERSDPAPLDVTPGPGPGCDHVGPIESMVPAYPEKYRCVKCYGSVWPLCECGDPLDSKVHGSGPHRHAYEADLTARAAATPLTYKVTERLDTPGNRADGTRVPSGSEKDNPTEQEVHDSRWHELNEPRNGRSED